MVGDQLLVAMARRLALCLRPGDTIARLGGDEFTILLDDVKDFANANFVAERIQKALALPFDLDGHEVFTTVSIGIAVSATGYDRPEDVLRDADIAMYRAKALGKARYEVFDTAMHKRFVTLLRLETDLRRALERQEFCVYYQPIVSLTTGYITGFEALLRWQHPRRGLVLPSEFIMLAEETGLIIAIDRWVLREAYRQMRLWQSRFGDRLPLSVSVNLSSKQFSQLDLIEHIDQTLQEQELHAHSLKLELTESMVMENAEMTAAMLADLRALDVRVSIDDFGTGYSSLSYLQRFPIDTLKIDRSFIQGIGADGDNTEIIQAITALAHNLGMDVIAEGIETAEQLAHLRALACEYGQGYYFARPVNSEATYQLLSDWPRW
jgi:EAL domain-containing protein (putative c-di-GMP-specific phosphodiesterase class I)